MTEKIYSVNIDEVAGLINDHFANKIRTELVQAVLSVVHKITSYQEEDKTFSFKIAMGTSDNRSLTAPSFYCIKKIPLSCDDLEKRIKKAIKDVAVFCSNDGDMYLLQGTDVIICGTYFTALEDTGKIEERMLDDGVVVLDSVQEGILALKIKRKIYGLNLTLDKNVKYADVPDVHLAEECCYWDGIFRHIKSSIHGTILLVVEPEWNAIEDDSFMSTPEEVGGIDISFDSRDSNANCLEMFYSMLDYDGITIIDTNGQIRSYHNFCKSKVDEDIPGGARHRALESLKNSDNENYRGVYFQSQEGKVEYFDFKSHHKYSHFDSTVMCLGDDNPYIREVQNYIEERNVILQKDKQHVISGLDDEPVMLHVIYLLKELRTAHFGFDNFSQEVKPSKALDDFFGINKEFINSLFESPSLAKYFINTVILCYIGNHYGYSFEGRSYIESIIRNISQEILIVYFENQDYISRKKTNKR